MAYKNIQLDYVEGVAIIKLNAPEVLNALSENMVVELALAVSAVAASDARCLLLTGEGRAFCAGANLQKHGASDAPRTVSSTALESRYIPLIHKLRNLEIPMVSAVNGPAVGVGMSFAIMADIVIAARSAYFLQAFANIGLVPDGGATFFLPRMIGWGRALELSLLAERLPAEKALDWGLVNKVVENEDLMTESLAIATRLANGPRSLGLIRKAYWESPSNSLAEQLQLESDLQNRAHLTSDHREGVSAFLEKRKATFTGN